MGLLQLPRQLLGLCLEMTYPRSWLPLAGQLPLHASLPTRWFTHMLWFCSMLVWVMHVL